ncbi:MAG: Holliday junction branch migration protein RuvA [Marinagarivorans sp.]|nr:Holliday junction branch migration protein RuvA [Marinagarivorans sp.]
MIGRLKGEVLEKQPPYLLLDVGGVGYEVLAPMSTFYRLPAQGCVVLHTHLSVTENSQQLFGFCSLQERSLFKQLIKVSGVGPKMALSVLSSMAADEVVSAIVNNNLVTLTSIPGVGKKTAERLVIEMRDRLKDWALADGSVGDLASPVQLVADDITRDAESAMIALGYKPAEAARAIALILKTHTVTKSEELIRLALRSMLPA